MLRNEADKLRRVIVCTPSEAYFDVADLQRHNIAEPADRELAIRQHDTLKACLSEFGCEVIDVAELESHPNSVFTRDTALCTPNGYIKVRLGLPARQEEGEWMSNTLQSLGEAKAGEISAPGTVEGGDVVLAGSVAFVGRSARTNAEGVSQLASLLSSMSYDVRVIDLPDSVLHLDKVLMVVAPERLLCCEEILPAGITDGFETIDVPFTGATSANVICLGENEVVVERTNTNAVGRLLAANVVTHVLDLSEFSKGVGGPNCLVLPINRWNTPDAAGDYEA